MYDKNILEFHETFIYCITIKDWSVDITKSHTNIANFKTTNDKRCIIQRLKD